MTFDYRLKKEKDFKTVFNKGKRLFSSSLTLIYLPSSELKAGFAVSKKHGGSVNRNRIKRLLRESFRSFIPEIGQNFFFVFIPKVKNEYTLGEFKENMAYILKKAGLIK
jgi:ribonuclease P protein component